MKAALFLLCSILAAQPVDHLQRGLTLAQQDRWDEARAAFEQGRLAYPEDPRFPIELAGVAFKQQRYSEARRRLHQALGRAPADPYVNDFLATLYLLDSNTEAALKYWNRAAKPLINRIRMEPQPEIDPVLLDRAFAFAAPAILTREDYLATRARLDFIEALPEFHLDLEASPESGFDAVLRSSRGPHPLASLLRGLPFQAITPRLATGAGLRFDSLLRWDKQKRRATVALSGPIARSATAGYRLFADGRNENWLTHGLNLRKLEAGAEMRILLGSRWQWTTAAIASRRNYRNLAAAGPLFAEGALLKYRGSISGRLATLPERRITLTGDASIESGRFFGANSTFRKAGLGLEARWSPSRDYEVAARARAGQISGAAPFDELFLLGIERDTDLTLRAHPGTLGGRKGASPLGRRFALFNLDAGRAVYRGGLATIGLGPFFDAGAAGGEFGSRMWLFDTGAQAKLSILGAAFVLSYGRDLRTGANAYYATITR